MWFLLSTLSVFTLAFAELTQQHLLNKINSFSPRSSVVLTFLFQSILTIPILLFSPLRNEIFSVFTIEIFPKLLLVSAISSFATIFYLRSFQVANISISTIFVSTSIILSTILGIVFFGESTSLIKFIGIGLTIMAIVSLHLHKVRIEKNHLFGLVAGMLFGLCYTIDKSIVLIVNPFIYIFWTFFLIALFAFLLKPKTTIKGLSTKRLTSFTPILISAIAYLLFNWLTFMAYRFGGEVGKVDAINNTQVFIIIIVEYFIFRQRMHIYKKITAAAMAFAGVSILGFLS